VPQHAVGEDRGSGSHCDRRAQRAGSAGTLPTEPLGSDSLDEIAHFRPGYDRDDERPPDDFERERPPDDLELDRPLDDLELLERPLDDRLPEDRRWAEEPRVLDDDLLRPLVEDRLRPPDEERLRLRPRD
jgi:hypothetical protein